MKVGNCAVSNNRDKSFLHLSLRKNFAWSLVGNTIYALTQWGILVSATKFLEPSDVGKFVFALAIAAPIFAFCNLQLRAILVSDAISQHPFSTYRFLRVCTSLISVLVISTLAFFISDDVKALNILVLIGLAKAVEAISDIHFGLLQKEGRLDLVAKSMILKGLMSYALFTTGVVVTENIILGLFGLLASWVAVLIIMDVPATIKTITKYKLADIKPFSNKSITELAILGAPMGLAITLGSLNQNIPRYFIVEFQDVSKLAYFSALSYLMIMGNMIIHAANQSVAPSLARYYDTNIASYRALVGKLILASAIVGVIGVITSFLAGRQILNILYTKAYGAYQFELVLIMLASLFVFTSSSLGVAITSARSFKPQVIIATATAVVITISSIILIDRYALAGAALALLIGFILKNIFQLAHLQALTRKC